jgi:ferric-dicitrate binding protein FerR (iron transport regulator)
VAGERTGRVVSVETGLVQVSCRGRLLRTTLGACMLAEMARTPQAAPRVGDQVRLRTWADGRITLETVLARPLP